jgi:RNA polymerase sigma factor (sigma-70 family)
MPASPLSEFIRYLRRISGAGDTEKAGDGELLERFVRRRDESAFETLMARHGPMVLGVCRRILGDPHDADDAFQATFLVLAHKAASVGRPQALSSWLYRIAQRAAVRAKVARNRRRARESVLDDLPAGESVEEFAWHELRPVLDEEVNRLPRKYRDVVVSCYLQEKTYTEAAKDLGLAAGTVSSRLARARDLLRKHLLHRGLALSSSLLVTLLAQQALSAAVPSALRTITTQAALPIAVGQTVLTELVAEPVAALTKEVLKAMFVTKLRMTGLVLLVFGILGAGAGVVTHGALTEKHIDVPKTETPPAAPRPPDKAVAKNKPKPEKPFENAFGYTWIVPPEDAKQIIDSVKSGGHHASIRAGVALLFSQATDGDLFIVMASAKLQGKPGPIALRPVVLDADRKRYLPSFNLGGFGAVDQNKVELSMGGYSLNTKKLPLEKVRYIGIEQLTEKGRKAIAARALERARKAGIEVLPPGHLGQVYDFTLTTLDDKRIRGRDLRGKVVLIDCWSTGCAPCMEKMPKLKQLSDKRHKDGFEIIGVSLDKDAETVGKVCAKKGLTWPQVFVPNDDKTRALWYEAAGLTSLPRLLVIDRQGILRADCRPDQLEEEITKWLDQSTEPAAELKK